MTTAALCVLLTLHVSCKHLMEDTNIQSPRESHNTYVRTYTHDFYVMVQYALVDFH